MSFATGHKEEAYSVPKAAANAAWEEEQTACYASREVHTRKF